MISYLNMMLYVINMSLYNIIYDAVEVHGSEIQAVDAENKQLFIDVQSIF